MKKRRARALLAALDPRYKYCAVDADGWLCAYAELPEVGVYQWRCNTPAIEAYVHVAKLRRKLRTDWETSLKLVEEF